MHSSEVKVTNDFARTGLNIIRMLKLFAWETYMLKVIAQHRLSELQKMKKKRLLETLMNSLNMCLPLIAKVMTFSIYVSQKSNYVRLKILTTYNYRLYL